MELISILLLVFPLLGFLAIGLFQKQMNRSFSGILASSVIFINLILAAILFNFVSSSNQTVETQLFDWIKFGDISIPMSLTVDRLSALMMLIVNGVGLLIHIYSIGYMKEDEGVNRFFAYMNLFVFFMLTLVLSSNYLMLFIGWEGVGLSSYLLIGFWFKDHVNNDAAKKAFIMNRIGDLGFLLGIFLLYSTFKTLSISEIAAKASLMPSGDLTLTAITLCLFIGAMGKSAQIPLFTWLPDAMAGPTPVSALIHAATMVTAGIYLIARSSVLFVLSPVTMNIILVIGAATAIVGGIIAIYQNDIKKVLAYSTVSQLGFMFMALGLGSFSGAMFHLTTHAFFKALLFLSAGSVIHALGNEQDIRKMGGLRKKIPFTFALFIIGTIAISGIPPFAGFFSKELILSAAYEHGTGMGILATAISLLTTLYMFRLLFVVFYKPESKEIKANHHIHESPKVMLYPMAILAILSVVAGFVQMPKLFSETQGFDTFLSPVFAKASGLATVSGQALSVQTEWLTLIIPISIIFVLIFLSYKRFVNNKELAVQTGIQHVFANKFYFDEIYDFFLVKPLAFISNVFRGLLDQTIINGFVNAVGNGTLFVGKRLRRLQTGNVGLYLIFMVFSIIAILFFNIIL
ncbi:MAG: NADH-quinone oxidoreductase subunit L [Paludibacter sp.]|nr:NADH-quinone oxidoreductase subunit L [Paludibacter sp.]